MCLYTASVHVVELLACHHGEGFDCHYDRNTWLRIHHGRVWSAYKILKEAGADARYAPHAMAHSPDDVDRYLYGKMFKQLVGNVHGRTDEKYDLPAALGIEFRQPVPAK